MRSSVVLFALAACVGTDDPTVVLLEASVGEEVVLDADEGADTMEHRWIIVDAPVAVQAPVGRGSVVFTPLVSGIYVIDHWLEDRVSRYLTDHFVITVEGTPPVADIEFTPTHAVGATATLDGSTSRGPVGIPLQFAWRLATRPGGSGAELSSLDMSTTTITLDVVGEYIVQLEVFDGQRWSIDPDRVVVTAR